MPDKIEKNETDTEINDNDPVKFKGSYISAIGRRKSSIATVRLYKKGNGVIMVNEKKFNSYFTGDKSNVIKQPLKLTGHSRDLNISVFVKGGGMNGQAEAVKHALSKSLIILDKELKPALKAKKLLTRDARIKERKKPGLKKARKAPQWAKR
jgi:small subunit ribosomal protein S9